MAVKRFVTAWSALALTGCSVLTPAASTTLNAMQAPCNIVDVDAVTAALEVRVTMRQNSPRCRFLDPRRNQVAMFTVKRLGDGADERIAQMTEKYGPDATVSDVRVGSTGITGTAFHHDHPADSYRAAGPTTSLGFAAPPYFVIVEVDDDRGGIDAAVALANVLADANAGE